MWNMKQRHRHKGTTIFELVYKKCVGMSCNPHSHDGKQLIEQCCCGQQRRININHRRGNEFKEYGTWHFPAEID